MRLEETPVLSVRNLVVRYGESCGFCHHNMEKNRCVSCGTVWAAKYISFDMYEGEVLGVVD